MPCIFATECLAVQEHNIAISLQRDGVINSLFAFQKHKKCIDPILHRFQEGQEPGKLP
jgi:hypothetical protein